MSTTWRPRDSRKCVPTPTGPGVSISTFVIALMRPEAFSKSDAMARTRSGEADDRYVQSSGFIGWVSFAAYRDLGLCVRQRELRARGLGNRCGLLAEKSDCRRRPPRRTI